MNRLMKKTWPIALLGIAGLTIAYIGWGESALAEGFQLKCCRGDGEVVAATRTGVADPAKIPDGTQSQSFRESLMGTIESAVACEITDPAELKEAKQAWRELMAKASNIIELDDGYRMNFESSNVMQLVEYIRAERECCPFFTFRLEFPPNNGPLKFDVTGPKMAKEMFGDLLKRGPALKK